MATYRTYRYWRLYGAGDNCCITAACEVDTETREARFAYAFCSPSEKTFNKKLAREIADGRLALEKSSVVLTLPDGEGLAKALNSVVFNEALVMYMEKRGCAGAAGHGEKGQVPRWVTKAVVLMQEDDYSDFI